jgi:hypothetical protein
MKPKPDPLMANPRKALVSPHPTVKEFSEPAIYRNRKSQSLTGDSVSRETLFADAKVPEHHI